MDRLNRGSAGYGLALSLALSAAGTGCRTPKPEVPPSPAFTTGPQAPVGFSQSPHPLDASAGAMPGGNNSQYGIPNPSSTPNYGLNGGNFSPPGTNLGAPPSADPMSGAGLSSPGGTTSPLAGVPLGGTGATGPAAGVGPAPGQNPFGR